MRYLTQRLSPDAVLDHVKTQPCQNVALDAICNKLSTHKHSKLFILHTKRKKRLMAKSKIVLESHDKLRV